MTERGQPETDGYSSVGILLATNMENEHETDFIVIDKLPECTHYRVASRANVLELEDFLLTLTRLMPPQTSLRQALAYIMIGRASVSGETVTSAQLARTAGTDARREAVFGPALKRTMDPLIDRGLVCAIPSEEDLRATNLSLTEDGLKLLRTAMDSIS